MWRKAGVTCGKDGVVWGEAGQMCWNEVVMYGKERETSGRDDVVWWKAGAPSGKVVKTFLHVVVRGRLVEHRLRLLEACCIRKWGGLCIRECGRTVSELRVLSWGFGNVFWGLGGCCGYWSMIRWLRGETVGDLCRESAHISCAMVAEGIISSFYQLFFSPLSVVSLFFYQLFLSPSSVVSLFFPLDISLFLS